MAHPFFDSLEYPWWYKPEADNLWRALYDGIREIHDISRIYKSCGQGLRPLEESSCDRVWQDALGKLASVGLLRTLCANLSSEDVWRSQQFKSAVQAVIEAKSVESIRVIASFNPVPASARAELNPVPVLDRVKLREQIAKLDSNAHPLKVLLLRGQKASGKSHSRYLFEHMARSRGATPVYLCQGMIGTVRDAVEELALALDPDYTLPEFYTSESATFQAIWREMLRIAKKRETTLWIAVDDLGVNSADGAPLMEEKVRLFFDQLAVTLANPIYRERFRLMLINYPAGVLPNWTSDVWKEDIAAESDIQAKHVADALTEWSVRCRKTLLQDEIDRYTQQVMEARTNPSPPRSDGTLDQRPSLKRMYDKLVEILTDLQDQ